MLLINIQKDWDTSIYVQPHKVFQRTHTKDNVHTAWNSRDISYIYLRVKHFLFLSTPFMVSYIPIQVQITDSKRNLAGLLLWMGENLNGKKWSRYGPSSCCDYDSSVLAGVAGFLLPEPRQAGGDRKLCCQKSNHPVAYSPESGRAWRQLVPLWCRR